MIGEDLRELLVAARRRSFQPPDHLAMRRSTPPQGDALVRDVARQGMVEDELAFAGDRRGVALLHEPLLDQAVEAGLDRGARELRPRRRPSKTRPTTAASWIARFSAGSSRSMREAMTRCTVSGGTRAAPGCVPRRPDPLERPVLDHHPEQLAREEGVPTRPRRDLVHDIVRRSPSEQTLEHQSSLESDSGGRSMTVASRRPAPQFGRSSHSSGRAVHSRTSAPEVRVASDSMSRTPGRPPNGRPRSARPPAPLAQSDSK